MEPINDVFFKNKKRLRKVLQKQILHFLRYLSVLNIFLPMLKMCFFQEKNQNHSALLIEKNQTLKTHP